MYFFDFGCTFSTLIKGVLLNLNNLLSKTYIINTVQIYFCIFDVLNIDKFTFLTKKLLHTLVLCTFLTLPIALCGQPAAYSYEKLWKAVLSDTTTKEEKLRYLDHYLQKARNEKNTLEEYRALEKKSYLLPFDKAVMLLHKMQPLVQKLKNDSLSGRFYNRSTTLYYKNRSFKEALDYAIQAEAFNDKINNLYNLNAARIDIGNIYYHTQRYQKAKEYFIQARDYYKSSDNYYHIQGYISSLYSLGKSHWQLEEPDAMETVIKESKQMLPKLKPQHKVIEAAYLNYIKGGKAFLQKDHAAAQNYFESALPEIQKNEDITNEYVIYLYLGKIKWEQNKKEEAVAFFTKIDELFQEKKFLNYELREAYDYLRAYYKETGQTEQQLQATENLIVLNRQFEKEHHHLTDVLHYQKNNQELESEKAALQMQLEENTEPTYGIWLNVSAGILTLMGIFLFWKKRRKKAPTKAAQEIEEPVTKQSVSVSKQIPDSTETQPQEKTEPLSPTEQRLLDKLKDFEQKKEYLKPTSLTDLATKFGTNRTTLSNFLNTHKGGYNAYLNKLRVEEAGNDLKTNKELRIKTPDQLAVRYGFVSGKAFSSQFKTEMNISLSDFIMQLEENEK